MTYGEEREFCSLEIFLFLSTIFYDLSNHMLFLKSLIDTRINKGLDFNYLIFSLSSYFIVLIRIFE